MDQTLLVIVLVGIFLFVLRANGYIGSNFFTERAIAMGTAIEVFLLSFALADRIKITEREKRKAQKETITKVETTTGVVCWRKSVAINKVGLYIPGGTAPLFSTLLMLGIPATIAGCKEIVICTPSDKNGKVNPVVLYVAQLIGIKNIYKIGGVQAIAAMAYGTATVPKVYKIFGPGNQYVTCAKQLVNKEGLAIDMPAGPSEVAVYADETSNAAFVAADLLSQAEHGADSQVVLVANTASIIDAVKMEIEKQSPSGGPRGDGRSENRLSVPARSSGYRNRQSAPDRPTARRSSRSPAKSARVSGRESCAAPSGAPCAVRGCRDRNSRSGHPCG